MEAPKGKLALLPDEHDLWAERPAAAGAQRQDEVPALPSRRDTRDFDAGGDRPEGHGGVSVRAGAGRAHVNVRSVGALDLATTGELDRQLGEPRAAGFDHLVVDSAAVTFLDSTGVHVLVRWATLARAEGWALRGPLRARSRRARA